MKEPFFAGVRAFAPLPSAAAVQRRPFLVQTTAFPSSDQSG